MKNPNFILSICLLFTLHTTAQVYTDKVVGKKNEAAIDSLKKSE